MFIECKQLRVHNPWWWIRHAVFMRRKTNTRALHVQPRSRCREPEHGHFMHATRAPRGAVPSCKSRGCFLWTPACSRSFNVMKMSDAVFAWLQWDQNSETRAFIFCSHQAPNVFYLKMPEYLWTLNKRIRVPWSSCACTTQELCSEPSTSYFFSCSTVWDWAQA